MDSTDSGSFSNSGSSTFGRCGFVTFGARAMEMYDSHQHGSENQLPWALPCFLPQCCMLLFSERRLRAWAFFEVDRRAKYQYYTTCMPLPTGSSGLLSWLKIVWFFRACLKIPSQIQGLLLQISSNQLNPGDVVRVPWFLHRCSVHRWIPRFMVPLGTISSFPQFVFFWNTHLQTRNLPEKSTSLLHGEFLIHPSFTGHFSPKKGWSSMLWGRPPIAIWELGEPRMLKRCLLVSKVSEIWVYLGIFLSH